MLTAPFVGIKHVFPIMKKSGFGGLMNMASINGIIGFAGKAGYNSAKHGGICYRKVAALEGAQYGITVNALCPGYDHSLLVRGQLEDLAKTRNVSLRYELVDSYVLLPISSAKTAINLYTEVADYAVFLASDKAQGVTGQAVILDGGYTVQ